MDILPDDDIEILMPRVDIVSGIAPDGVSITILLPLAIAVVVAVETLTPPLARAGVARANTSSRLASTAEAARTDLHMETP
jgi:hypothetical protein